MDGGNSRYRETGSEGLCAGQGIAQGGGRGDARSCVQAGGCSGCREGVASDCVPGGPPPVVTAPRGLCLPWSQVHPAQVALTSSVSCKSGVEAEEQPQPWGSAAGGGDGGMLQLPTPWHHGVAASPHCQALASRPQPARGWGPMVGRGRGVERGGAALSPRAHPALLRARGFCLVGHQDSGLADLLKLAHRHPF